MSLLFFHRHSAIRIFFLILSGFLDTSLLIFLMLALFIIPFFFRPSIIHLSFLCSLFYLFLCTICIHSSKFLLLSLVTIIFIRHIQTNTYILFSINISMVNLIWNFIHKSLFKWFLFQMNLFNYIYSNYIAQCMSHWRKMLE